jgi:hypothetical protein
VIDAPDRDVTSRERGTAGFSTDTDEEGIFIGHNFGDADALASV